jgi:hypothetical protein
MTRFEDGRWNTMPRSPFQVFMEGGMPVRIRCLERWSVPVGGLHVVATPALAQLFGACIRVGAGEPNGDYLEAPLEMQ